MPKLSINDVEYNTDDFNEEQLKLYNEAVVATDQMRRLEVQHKALEGLSNVLASQIVEAGKDAKDKPEA
jgi:hypothetical protein